MSETQGKSASQSSADITREDPAQVFIPGPVVSDEDEFGTVISATVANDFVARVGTASVTIRILPLGKPYSTRLRKVVDRVSKDVHSTAVVKYIGVWELSPTETWLVSKRSRVVSVGNLLANVWSSDTESLIAHIAHRCLEALRDLHGRLQYHGDLRPSNIYLNDDTDVCFGDMGIYQVLSEALASRRSLPGIKLWPLERTSENSTAMCNEDIWDFGVALLVLVDGGAAVARSWRSGQRLPKLTNSSRWSAQFNSFMSLIFSRCASAVSPTNELLRHRFVSGSSSTACRVAMEEYRANGDELRTDNYTHDTISALFLQNTAVVRAPLISIDDISSDQFSFEQWNGHDENRPNLEMSLLRILRNNKEQPLPMGVEEYKSLTNVTSSLEALLETADMI